MGRRTTRATRVRPYAEPVCDDDGCRVPGPSGASFVGYAGEANSGAAVKELSTDRRATPSPGSSRTLRDSHGVSTDTSG
jgi:hypothetical protein